MTILSATFSNSSNTMVKVDWDDGLVSFVCWPNGSGRPARALRAYVEDGGVIQPYELPTGGGDE